MKDGPAVAGVFLPGRQAVAPLLPVVRPLSEYRHGASALFQACRFLCQDTLGRSSRSDVAVGPAGEKLRSIPVHNTRLRANMPDVRPPVAHCDAITIPKREIDSNGRTCHKGSRAAPG